MKTLPQITGPAGFDGDDVALAAEIYHVMKSYEFVFTLVFMKDLLHSVEPVTKALQGRSIGYKDSMPLIRAVYKVIEEMGSQENFEKFYSQAADLLQRSQAQGDDVDPTPFPSRPIRHRRRSSLLQDFVVEETLGQRRDPKIILKSTYHETIDIVLSEMVNRFVKDDAILTAIDTADEMDWEKLQPLTELGIIIPTKLELQIANTLMKYVKKNNRTREMNWETNVSKVRY